MMGRTHLSAGVILGTVMAANTTNVIDLNSAAIIASASIGALTPDVDLPQSKMGHILFPISYPLHMIFGHRGFIHSPILYLLIAVLWMIFFPQYNLLMWGFLLGVASHLFLDMLNPEGIPILYPMRKKISIGKIKAGSIWETLFCCCTAICIGLYIFKDSISPLI